MLIGSVGLRREGRKEREDRIESSRVCLDSARGGGVHGNGTGNLCG